MHRGILGRAASHYVRTSVFLHTERRKTWRPDKVLKMKESLSEGEKPYVKRPKALGDIRGISYIYPLFDQFGLIETDPDKNGKNGIQLCLQLEEASVHNEAEANTEGETT